MMNKLGVKNTSSQIEWRCAGRGRKTWYECVKDDMKVLGLHAEWAVFRDMWRGFISGRKSNPS